MTVTATLILLISLQRGKKKKYKAWQGQPKKSLGYLALGIFFHLSEEADPSRVPGEVLNPIKAPHTPAVCGHCGPDHLV